MNIFVSDKPWETNVDTGEDNVPPDDDDNEVAFVEKNLADGDYESHHGLYWRHDGVLEEPLKNIPKMRG
jgi:hypothetical protein